MFSSHIKAPVLKKILLENKTCEEKFNNLRELLGIPSEGTVQEQNNETANNNENSKEKILLNLTAFERKLGSQVLDYIQASNFISWNTQTLNLILDGKEIEYSDIAKLLKKVVQSTSPVQPIAFVLFIEALLRLKLPLKFFRDGDSVNTTAQLLLIKDQTSAGFLANQLSSAAHLRLSA